LILQVTPSAMVYEPERPDATSRTIGNLQPGVSYSVVLIGETAESRRSAPLRFRVWSGRLKTGFTGRPASLADAVRLAGARLLLLNTVDLR